MTLAASRPVAASMIEVLRRTRRAGRTVNAHRLALCACVGGGALLALSCAGRPPATPTGGAVTAAPTVRTAGAPTPVSAKPAPPPPTARPTPGRAVMIAALDAAWAQADWPAAVKAAEAALAAFPDDAEIKEKLFAARVNLGDVLAERG